MSPQRWNWKHVPKIKINQNRFQWMLHLDPIKKKKVAGWSAQHLTPTPTTNYVLKIRFTVNIYWNGSDSQKYFNIINPSAVCYSLKLFHYCVKLLNEWTNKQIQMRTATHIQPQHRNVSSCELVIYVLACVNMRLCVCVYVYLCTFWHIAMLFGELEFLFASNLMSHFIVRCYKNIPTKWS